MNEHQRRNERHLRQVFFDAKVMAAAKLKSDLGFVQLEATPLRDAVSFIAKFRPGRSEVHVEFIIGLSNEVKMPVQPGFLLVGNLYDKNIAGKIAERIVHKVRSK